MKMRARMVDGSPVTFESTDLSLMYELSENWEDGLTPDPVYAKRFRFFRPVHVTEFVGEGFFVRSIWDGMAQYLKSDDPIGYHRMAFDRSMLERSGVDTATVEYLDCLLEHRFDRLMPSDLREHWEPMWPQYYRHAANVPPGPSIFDPPKGLKGEPATAVPGGITYMGEDELITEAMLANGCARLHEALIEGARLDGGMILMSDSVKAVSSIWRSMRSAQRLHGSK